MTVNQLGQLCASAAVSASITGFAPNGNFANLTATNSSASVALPAGAVVIFQNTGTTTVSCTVGIGSATALVSEVQIPASSSVPFTVGSNTFGACIDQTGSASNVIALAGGAGLFTGFGGGGGGGSGGVVTNAGTFAVQLTGATNNINNIAGTVSLPTGAATSALQTTINTTLGTPFQAGGSIGNTTFTATQATGTNLHSVVDSGTITTVSTVTNLAQQTGWAGGTLGAMANYGSSPGAVLVPSVNAFVTNANANIGNNADAVASGATAGSPVVNYNYVFNGTTFDRMRSGTTTGSALINGAGTAGAAAGGIVTVQGVASMTKLLVTPDSVALPANQSVNVAQFGGVSTATGQVAVSVAPVTATNTALVVDLRPDSPGIIALGPNTAANSVPVTVGPTVLGSYCMGANTGTMAAGLAGGSPIYSFRYGGANLAIVRKVMVEADNITTAFVAGAAKLDLIAARSFSASDTGGTAATLTGNNGKLRTSYATTAVSDLRISSTATLTAGTRTLDAQPLASVEFAVPTSIDADLLPTTALFQVSVGEQPFILANNEGFVIQATVPGTGTWVGSVRTCWDEVSSF